jgi:hypothetical protein
MAELKTRPTKASVAAFIAKVSDEQRRKDCKAVVKMMREVTGSKPEMWGPSIVGFGRYTYRYESGRELDWFSLGFSPRKGSLTLYLMAGFRSFPDLMKKLGKYKTGQSCLYVSKLADINQPVLRELMKRSDAVTRRTYARQ